MVSFLVKKKKEKFINHGYFKLYVYVSICSSNLSTYSLPYKQDIKLYQYYFSLNDPSHITISISSNEIWYQPLVYTTDPRITFCFTKILSIHRRSSWMALEA